MLDDHRIELLDDAAVNEDRVGDVQRRLILAELNLHNATYNMAQPAHAMCRMQVATRQLQGSYKVRTSSYKAAIIITTVPALA